MQAGTSHEAEAGDPRDPPAQHAVKMEVQQGSKHGPVPDMYVDGVPVQQDNAVTAGGVSSSRDLSRPNWRQV